jgi:hypothetical protein
MIEMQREALAVLAEVLELSPDVRLGQLMANLGFLGEVHLGNGLGYIEDDELIAVLYRHLAELRSRLEGTPNEASQPGGVATSVSGSSTDQRQSGPLVSSSTFSVPVKAHRHTRQAFRPASLETKSASVGKRRHRESSEPPSCSRGRKAADSGLARPCEWTRWLARDNS